MKLKLLLWVGIASLLFSCSSEPKVTIKFCESLDQHDQCPSEQDQFKLGEKVFVRCESEDPFVTKKITGKIYKLEKGNKLLLGDKDFNLNPGDTYITQAIPFDEFGYEALGVFSIEFVNAEDQLLAKRELTINDD